jgi:dihydropyrimidinase
MSERTLLVRGGTIVSESAAMPGDLLIKGERVAARGAPGAFAAMAVDEVLDASGKMVLPGLIDPHLHLNSPFMGTISLHDYANGSRAAAYGGVTTIIDFSTQPKGGSLIAALAQKEEEARGRTLIDWSMSGIILDADEQTLAELPQLVKAGVPTYKCFTTYKQSGRLMDDDSLLHLLEATARCGGMLMIHCEHDAIIEYRLQRELAAGHYAPIYHARTRPAVAENEAIRRIITLMKEVPAPVYIVHTSTAESVPMIEKARLEGLPIHSETCTHYLTLTEQKLEEPNGMFYICSPPLRTQRDIDALWQGVACGAIEVISSDDAGVPSADRIRIGGDRFDKVPSGMPAIEPRLTILYTEGVRRGRITMSRLVALTASNPARLFGLYPRKGHLAPGADADLVIFDPEVAWTMSASTLHMNTDFCPFEGWPVYGRPQTVICRGEYVICDDELVGKPGWGQRVFRQLSLRWV